jgi:hypothetical protein
MHLAQPLTLREAGPFLQHEDAWVRGWTLQLLGEGLPAAPAERWEGEGARNVMSGLATMAREDASPVVRRYIASLLQRIPAKVRQEPLAALLAHAEDATDAQLPLLYWYAAEGVVVEDPDAAVELLKACRIPKVREFIARRLAALTVAAK